MDSPWHALVEGHTHYDEDTDTYTAYLTVLPHRVDYPRFRVQGFNDTHAILAHVGARLDLPDRALHVDFAPIVRHSPPQQKWTVWRDEPWPDLDTWVTTEQRPHPNGPDGRGEIPGPSSPSAQRTEVLLPV